VVTVIIFFLYISYLYFLLFCSVVKRLPSWQTFAVRLVNGLPQVRVPVAEHGWVPLTRSGAN